VHPNIKVTDSILSLKLIGDDHSPSVHRHFMTYFASKHIPLTIVDITKQLLQVKDETLAPIKKLYLSTSLILVRPDLYVTWFLLGTPYSPRMKPTIKSLSALEIYKITQIACGEIVDDEENATCCNMNAWLTRRFVDYIQGTRTLHR
jgi:hypothetical protein